MVFAVQSVFSIIVPHFVVPANYRDREQPVVSTSDLVFIDGIFYARGWRELTYGQARWNNWIELRMPIIEQVIWFDQFFEMAAIWDELSRCRHYRYRKYAIQLRMGASFYYTPIPPAPLFGKEISYIEQWRS